MPKLKCQTKSKVQMTKAEGWDQRRGVRGLGSGVGRIGEAGYALDSGCYRFRLNLPVIEADSSSFRVEMLH
jgi:hypothetical protein